jgi:4-amino-4-deoxy-L-arabinose transferase-like glycosyltransferase
MIDAARTSTSTAVPRRLNWLYICLALALLLRAAYSLAQDPLAPYMNGGGDTGWYLDNGARLVGGDWVEPLTPPPLYLIFVGLPQLVFPPEWATIVIRLLQVAASTATCYFAYRIARTIAGERAGIVAAAAFALHPIFVIESGNITSETIFLFFLSASLTAYVETIKREQPMLRHFALVGVLLALATFTRAALLAFPLGLVIHLFLAYRPARALKYSVTLLLVFALVLSTWTVYYKLRWDRWIIAGEGLEGFLYLGATGWQGPFQTDEQLDALTGEAAPNTPRDEQYVEAAQNIIFSNIGAYLSRRANEWAGAYLTPHGVEWFPGESLRALAQGWLRDDFTVAGFTRLIQGESFVPKLIFYLVHYTGIILGVLGMWATRKHWRLTLPLIGYVAYVTLMHFVLYALPRYIFPATIIYWVFAAIWIANRLNKQDAMNGSVSLSPSNPKDA